MTEAASSSAGLSPDELDELDALLDDLRTRDELVPHWEFCDGVLTALACTRRPVLPQEWLPFLLVDTDELLPADGPLPLLAPFRDLPQQERFLQLWERRRAQVQAQLAHEPDSLDHEDAFQPEVIDMRGAIASLPEAERAEMQGQEIPSFGQIWALGFMFAVENWPEEWAAPRDKEAAQWLDDAMEHIVALTEDDTGKPAVNLYDDQGPASTSQERVEAVGESIWACYDLRQIWKSFGPRVETVRKEHEPGRNDPCPCGSGKKYKKCHGA